MVVFPLCADVLAQAHCLPAFVMFLAAIVASVQGSTLLTLHLGIILFIQILYSLTIFLRYDDCKHEVAYMISCAYGLSIVHGRSMIGPAGALTCLAFALMTAHYVCHETFVEPVSESERQNDLDENVEAL